MLGAIDFSELGYGPLLSSIVSRSSFFSSMATVVWSVQMAMIVMMIIMIMMTMMIIWATAIWSVQMMMMIKILLLMIIMVIIFRYEQLEATMRSLLKSASCKFFSYVKPIDVLDDNGNRNGDFTVIRIS